MFDSIAFIGGGVMAEAMIQGLLNKKTIAPDGITVSEPREKRRSEIAGRYNIHATGDNCQAAKSGEIVVLSIKPQILARVLPELKGQLRPEQLVLSIIAGGRIGTIAEGTAHAAIVRAMPNTPAQIGEGVTVWTATTSVSAKQREQASAVFQSLGKDIFVDEEKYLDMATAVSGTGPTYVFLVLEALIDAAVHLGFSRDIAHDLVIEMMRGSILFAEKSGKHPAELRNMVTSPGGTSAEAIYQMEKGALRTVLSKAVWAAYQKSRLLGESVGKAEPRHPVDA
ncbi:MAG: pyrroline-5-carboxylate reductase [Chloroflexi bacterium RBG_16_56_8]|nr:MAG: pyrroline-5-carboxylate reductase [Chloroflexi bacterium RBG_16_56_8]